MHELRQFNCTKLELSNRGGLNLEKCVIISTDVSAKPKRPNVPDKRGQKFSIKKRNLEP